MGLLSPILRNTSDDGVAWWCPGCNEAHRITVGDGNRHPRWAWNGDANKPTFTPSVDVKSGHYASSFQGSCWCTYDAEQIEKGLEPSGYSCQHCHCFVVNGQIQFLSDCTHALASQTVDIPPWPRQD